MCGKKKNGRRKSRQLFTEGCSLKGITKSKLYFGIEVICVFRQWKGLSRREMMARSLQRGRKDGIKNPEGSGVGNLGEKQKKE